LKHDAVSLASNIKPVPTGIDFFFAKQQDARKLIEFIHSVLPCKDTYAQQLISQDIRNNTFDYKHTYCVEICPITKDCLVCLPKKLAQSYGNLSQVVVCSRVTNVISLIDPFTLQMVDVNGLAYFKNPFEIFMGPNTMVEFYVVDEEPITDFHRGVGHGFVSTKHQLSHVWVTRSCEVGVQDAPVYSVRTHLGKILRIGDSVMGYDLMNTNVNSPLFDKMPEQDRPDVILVRKVHQKQHNNDEASTVNEVGGITKDMEEMDLE